MVTLGSGPGRSGRQEKAIGVQVGERRCSENKSTKDRRINRLELLRVVGERWEGGVVEGGGIADGMRMDDVVALERGCAQQS